MVQQGWVSCLACFSLVWLAQGAAWEDRRSEFQSPPLSRLAHVAPEASCGFLGAQLPREIRKRLAGEDAMRAAGVEGWGVSGRRRGGEAERGQ